jgi:O-antigen ligase
MVSFIGVIVGIPNIILLGFFGTVVIIPWIIVLLKKDLTNGLIIWFFLVLFNGVFGQLTLSMLPDISFYRIMWILLFLSFLSQIALKERDLLPITKIEIAMILFCIVCLVSMFRAGSIFKAGEGLVLSDFLNNYAIPFSILFLSKQIMDNEEKIKKLFNALLIIGIYLTFTGIFEHFNLTALVFPRTIMDPYKGIHFGRARGPFLQAEINGTILGMILVASVYVVLHKRRRLSKIFYIIFTSLIPITIFFTYTRACWLGFISSILVVPLFYQRLRKIFLSGFFIVFIITILNWSNVTSPDRTVGGVTAMNPVYDRINVGAASLDMFINKPIFGFGFNTFASVYSDYFYKVNGIPYQGVSVGSHHTLLTILVEVGLVGFVPLMLIFFYIFKHSKELYRKSPPNPFLGKGLVAIFWGTSIVYIINMQFVEMRYFLFPNSLFFMLAGTVVGLNQRLLLYKEVLLRKYKQEIKAK